MLQAQLYAQSKCHDA